MCSAVFMTGYDIEFAAEHVGYFTGPYDERAKVGKPVVDTAKKTVSITLPSGVDPHGGLHRQPGLHHAARRAPTSSSFTPKTVSANLPSAGGAGLADGRPAAQDAASRPSSTKRRSRRAVDAAFSIPDAETTAFVVTWKGRLIGERYGDGITTTTPLESWSMGKSVTSTIMGTLIHKGVYTLDQPAPIPEWQAQPNDPRAQIKIQDILRMSSGIRIISPSRSRLRPEGPIPGSPLPLHGRRRHLQVRRDTSAAVAAQHGGPLPQHRSGADQLPEQARRREAEGRLPVVSAAPPVGQDRRPHDGDGDRSLRATS